MTTFAAVESVSRDKGTLCMVVELAAIRAQSLLPPARNGAIDIFNDSVKYTIRLN